MTIGTPVFERSIDQDRWHVSRGDATGWGSEDDWQASVTGLCDQVFVDFSDYCLGSVAIEKVFAIVFVWVLGLRTQC